jgi:hypothetical protein
LIYVWTHLFDHTSAIVAGRVRQLGLTRIRSRTNVSLHWINADRVHSNKHLTEIGPRHRRFFHLKSFRAPELMDSNRFHELSYVPQLKHQIR